MAEGSVIGQGTVVRGNVRGDGSLEIYGRVDGDVLVTGDVTLGDQASVRGDISGARITIGGTVVGELRGSEAVLLERTAQVTGDITAPRVGIEEGARARGALRTEEPAAQSTGRAEQRRAVPRPLEMPRRAEPPAQSRAAEAPPPRASAPVPRAVAAPPPAQKRQPPAPVVPAFRGLQARKKKVRGR
ncbi:MAG TPA: polymer-forming cytoskeletal protein [Polyangiaceae bacterium]|jgi:cytoskeletal protein CcmA (bactofilin family)|nr:polymer-forming cytoskeletal protein [Polyangiaceae bacterium]